MLVGFQDEDAAPDFEGQTEDDAHWISMQQSLFALPEVYKKTPG